MIYCSVSYGIFGTFMDIRKSLLLLSVAGLSVWVACGDRTPPVLRDFSITQPNAQAPLAAVLSVLTDEPVRVRVDVSGGLEDVIRNCLLYTSPSPRD